MKRARASKSTTKIVGGTIPKEYIPAVIDGIEEAIKGVRACLAATTLQAAVKELAAHLSQRDGIALQLRVGLSSGRVIAGEIGSTTASYTTIGEHVGMAQRMESAAPPGGVLLSESTARLVESGVVLGDRELVWIKNLDAPVPARQLIAIGEHQPRRLVESKLVGRTGELNTITGFLDEAVTGAGCVVGVTGSAGIGKSRLIREMTAIAAARGIEVFTTHCESHTGEIAFRAVARMLRSVLGVSGLDPVTARAGIRELFCDAKPDDLLLFDDLLGIRDPDVSMPEIAADARRRRLTALINAAALARTAAAVYVIEDAHWIDEPSETMLATLLTVVTQVPALVLISYRPEYRGALSRARERHTVALRPMSHEQSSLLTAQLLGEDPSLSDLASQVSARAAGNPFFLEEIVRDLAERGVIEGVPGQFRRRDHRADVEVPATLQATIGARIDRLSATAKRTINAAAVVGTRFEAGLLGVLVDDIDVNPLIDAQLVEQTSFAPRIAYAFRHPLIHSVTYESQLKSDRALLHRRLATALEQRGRADEKATLIAEHYESAGDLTAAFDWHMRAGTWFTFRDIVAARSCWRRAQHAADALPGDHPERMAMRIAPRMLLCASAFRVVGSGNDSEFDDLRELCAIADDQRSLAIGMGGRVLVEQMKAHHGQALRVSSEYIELLDSLGDPTVTIAMLPMTLVANLEAGRVTETLRLAQRVIDIADGDIAKGNVIIESPLVTALGVRGAARWCLGLPGWRADLDEARSTSLTLDTQLLTGVLWFTYVMAVPFGVVLPDAKAMKATADALVASEQSGDDLAVDLARMARGVVLFHHDGPDRAAGLELLVQVRSRALTGRFSLTSLPIADLHQAMEAARSGDPDCAIRLAGDALDDLSRLNGSIWIALATQALVDALLLRRSDGDLDTAEAAIEWLAAVPTDPGFVLNEITALRLRALTARAAGDDAGYRHCRDRYRKLAADLGFEGHRAWAETMP